MLNGSSGGDTAVLNCVPLLIVCRWQNKPTGSVSTPSPSKKTACVPSPYRKKAMHL